MVDKPRLLLRVAFAVKLTGGELVFSVRVQAPYHGSFVPCYITCLLEFLVE